MGPGGHVPPPQISMHGARLDLYPHFPSPTVCAPPVFNISFHPWFGTTRPVVLRSYCPTGSKWWVIKSHGNCSSEMRVSAGVEEECSRWPGVQRENLVCRVTLTRPGHHVPRTGNLHGGRYLIMASVRASPRGRLRWTEVVPEIDANPVSFYSGWGGPTGAPPQTPVIGSRSACSPGVSTPHFSTWRRPCVS